MKQSGLFLSGNICRKVLMRSVLGHDFYSANFLPDNDRVWHTVSPYARWEIFKRLLELNDSCHAEEEAAEDVKPKKTAKRTKVGHSPELGL
jgi:hypothetical protein